MRFNNAAHTACSWVFMCPSGMVNDNGYLSCNVDDLIKRDVAAVLYVLDLLAIPLRLLKGLNDHG